MSDFLHSYLVVGLIGLAAVVLSMGTLALSSLVRPTRREPQKYLPYESGVEPSPTAWTQTHLRYYLYALLFVVFDVEVVFIVPWAVQVESFGGFGLVEMLIFVAVLALGLAYAWRKKVLHWQE